MAWAAALSILPAVFFVALTPALAVVARPPSNVVQPEIVVPGDWATDEAERFLFLPLTVPEDVHLEQCKIMTNGQSLLVVVTERPQDDPETDAIKKYKLVMEAIKQEAGHDENVLKSKLSTWLETEDDDEVRTHIRAALDSVTAIRQVKEHPVPRTVSIPLGMLAHDAAVALGASNGTLARPLLRGTTSLTSLVATSHKEHSELRAAIIKESFAVEIPYPVAAESVFILKTDPGTLVIGMPLVRQSLEAAGISTGGRPYSRAPVFDVQGNLLAGPAAKLKELARGLQVQSVAAWRGLKPLGSA